MWKKLSRGTFDALGSYTHTCRVMDSKMLFLLGEPFARQSLVCHLLSNCLSGLLRHLVINMEMPIPTDQLHLTPPKDFSLDWCFGKYSIVWLVRQIFLVPIASGPPPLSHWSLTRHLYLWIPLLIRLNLCSYFLWII